MIIILLLIINAFIGSLTWYLRHKELSLGVFIASFFCGWIIPCMFIFEIFCKIMDRLDEIKLIKKRKRANK